MVTYLLIAFAAIAAALFVIAELRIRVLQANALAMQAAVLGLIEALPKMSRDIHYLHHGLVEARSELDLPAEWEGGNPTHH